MSPGRCDLNQVRFPDAVQLSVAAGSVQETAALHWPMLLVLVMLDGELVMTGNSESVTVIIKVQTSLVLFEASFAV